MSDQLIAASLITLGVLVTLAAVAGSWPWRLAGPVLSDGGTNVISAPVE